MIAKILTAVLFNLLGKVVTEKVITKLACQLISLGLEALKKRKVFKDPEIEAELDMGIIYLQRLFQEALKND